MKNLTILKYFPILLGFAPVIFAATPSANTLTQKQTSALANPIRKAPRKPYSARIESRVMYGNERSFIRPMFLLPLIQSPNKIIFTNLITMGDTKKNLEGNIGFGARWLKKTYITGGFIHYDFRRTKNKKQVHQVTVGLEFFQKYLEYRVNIYVPLQERVFIENQTVAGGTYNSTNISSTYTISQTKIYEVTRKGLDLEVGSQLPQHTPFAAFVRLFYFHHDEFDKIYGVQLRASYQVREWLELRGSYTANNVKNQKNHYFAGVNFIWQFGRERHQEFLNQLSRKMVHMPIRDLDVDTREEQDFLGVIKTRTIPGRGILIPSGNVKADPNSNIVFNSIDEANNSLKLANITIVHVATVTDSDGNSGKIFVTDEKGETGSMPENLMQEINLGILDKNILDLTTTFTGQQNAIATLGELAINKTEADKDKRPSIQAIRTQGKTEDAEQQAYNNKVTQKNAALQTEKNDLTAQLAAKKVARTNQQDTHNAKMVIKNGELNNLEIARALKENEKNDEVNDRDIEINLKDTALTLLTIATDLKQNKENERDAALLDRVNAQYDQDNSLAMQQMVRMLNNNGGFVGAVLFKNELNSQGHTIPNDP